MRGRRRARQRLVHASASPPPFSSPVIDIAGIALEDDEDDDSEEDDGWGADEDGWGDATGEEEGDGPRRAFAPPSATNPPAWGPRAVCLAGFPAPEAALLRSLLDRLGLDDAKVLPLSTADLDRPAAAALAAPERDWSAPAPPDASGLGSGWGVGAPRVAVFGGLTPDEQAGVLAALDAAGLPMVGGVAVEPGTATTEPLGVAVAAAAAAARADRLAGRGPAPTPSSYTPDFTRGAADAASLPDAAELVERAGAGGVEVVEAGGGTPPPPPPPPGPSAAQAAGLPADWQAVAAAAGPAFMADLAANTVGVGAGHVDFADGGRADDDGGVPPPSPSGALPPSLLDVVVATSLAGEAMQEVTPPAAAPAPAPRRGFGGRPKASAPTSAKARPAPPPAPTPDDDADAASAYFAAAAPKSGKDALAAAAAKKKRERTKANAAAVEAPHTPPPPPPPPPPQAAVIAEPVGLEGEEAAAHARIVADLDAKFRKPAEGEGARGSTAPATTPPDQAALAERMRAEAQAPTRDAIEAAISCGLTVDEIVAMAKAAAALKEEGAKGLAVPWSKMPRLLDPTPTEVGERGAPGRGGGGQDTPASELSEEELEAMARARGLALPPRDG